MKHITKLLFCAALVFAAACHKDKDQPVSASLSSVLAQGSWIIHYYFDNKDETTIFSGYVFTFSANGTFTLKNGAESYTGAWQEVTDNGKKKLVIQVNTINFIQKLNDNWGVRSYNATFVELNGSTVTTNQLHLMRI
jgi:hypothetical protein